MKVEKRKFVLRTPNTTFCRRASPSLISLHSLIGCAVILCGWHGHLSADTQDLGSKSMWISLPTLQRLSALVSRAASIIHTCAHGCSTAAR